LGILVGIVEAREGRKEREVQDKRGVEGEWKGSSRSGRSSIRKMTEPASSRGRNVPSPSYNNTENGARQKQKQKQKRE
jgi:hypothetical protein